MIMFNYLNQGVLKMQKLKKILSNKYLIYILPIIIIGYSIFVTQSDSIKILQTWLSIFLIGLSLFPFTYKISKNLYDKGMIF